MRGIYKKVISLGCKTIRYYLRLWRANWRNKIIIILLLFISAVLVIMFGISRWYIASNQNQPFKLGATFIPAYASSLGLEPKETMDALIDDLGVQNFRLTSYWNQIEHTEGKYDFSELDWQFEKAERVDAKISLAVGLRQPRWPECHTPDWAKNKSVSDVQPQLNAYISAVVNRYKNSPSLASYQLENEFFNDFGTCTDFDRNRLASEYKLIKKLDKEHPILVSKSNNFPLPALGEPNPDIVGVSIYRRVWDANVTKQYFNYPLPAWYYAANAGVQKILTGRDSSIHELQMEAWPPDGKFIADVSLDEQNKSMNAAMFADRVEFAKNTGMKSADLWGAEWWYYRKVIKNDSSLWNEAKKAYQKN